MKSHCFGLITAGIFAAGLFTALPARADITITCNDTITAINGMVADVVPVPEPSILILTGLGLSGLLVLQFRRKR